MFKTKRASLVRRLWRSRVVARDGATRAEGARWPVTHAEPEDVCESGVREEHEDRDRRVTCCLLGDCCPRTPAQDETGPDSSTHALLKRLTEPSLEALLRAAESRGGDTGECVLVPGPDPGQGPRFVMCRTFRWSDLRPEERLKALCFCRSHRHAHGATVCCNPYHYSRLSGADLPLPNSQSHSPEHRPEDLTGTNPEAVPTRRSPTPHTGSGASDSGASGSVASGSGTSLGSSWTSLRSHWCRVAYWEQRTRVGRLYPAHDPALSIFYHLPQGTGLCLGQLQANAYQSRQERPREHQHGGGAETSAQQQSRRKIGFGILLSQEEDGVWVYNRSQHSVFVHSPTLGPLEAPGGRGLTVERVLPGYSLRVFDYERSSWMKQHGVKPQLQEGPWDPNSIRISFAKGWGPCYSRQFITSCPCWLEVLLNTHR